MLNRQRFFYAVFVAVLIYINVADSTSTNAFVPQVSNKPILAIQQPINVNNLREEDLIIQGMKVNEYPVETVVATGYTAGAESTGKTPSHPAYGITYAGVPVKRDVYSTIAADLSTYPLGTILYIPGYGYGVVTDIGSAIQGNKIDLYYESIDEVYNEWGKQTVDVYVVHIGDGSITEEVFNALNEQEDATVFYHK